MRSRQDFYSPRLDQIYMQDRNYFLHMRKLNDINSTFSQSPAQLNSFEKTKRQKVLRVMYYFLSNKESHTMKMLVKKAKLIKDNTKILSRLLEISQRSFDSRKSSLDNSLIHYKSFYQRKNEAIQIAQNNEKLANRLITQDSHMKQFHKMKSLPVNNILKVQLRKFSVHNYYSVQIREKEFPFLETIVENIGRGRNFFKGHLNRTVMQADKHNLEKQAQFVQHLKKQKKTKSSQFSSSVKGKPLDQDQNIQQQSDSDNHQKAVPFQLGALITQTEFTDPPKLNPTQQTFKSILLKSIPVDNQYKNNEVPPRFPSRKDSPTRTSKDYHTVSPTLKKSSPQSPTPHKVKGRFSNVKPRYLQKTQEIAEKTRQSQSQAKEVLSNRDVKKKSFRQKIPVDSHVVLEGEGNVKKQQEVELPNQQQREPELPKEEELKEIKLNHQQIILQTFPQVNMTNDESEKVGYKTQRFVTELKGSQKSMNDSVKVVEAGEMGKTSFEQGFGKEMDRKEPNFQQILLAKQRMILQKKKSFHFREKRSEFSINGQQSSKQSHVEQQLISGETLHLPRIHQKEDSQQRAGRESGEDEKAHKVSDA